MRFKKTKKETYSELKADKELEKIIKYIPKGKVLDIGSGNGRNSIFLAKNGFQVEAIDKNKEYVQKLKKFSEKERLPIKTKLADVKNLKLKEDYYSLILSVAILDFLRIYEFKKLIPKIKKSLKVDGIFYLVVFSIKDPAFKKCKKELKMVGKNTFYLPQLKTFRHFFEKKEMLSLLKGFRVLKIETKKIKDINNKKSHFHQIIRITVKKRIGDRKYRSPFS